MRSDKHSATRGRQNVSVAHAPLVIVNPTAGGGRAARSVRWIRDRLSARSDARVEVARRRGDIAELSAAAHRAGHGRVIVVGGDGSIQEAINGIANGTGPVELGIVPRGSGNDLARGLGLPRDLERSWRVAVGHRTRAVDVARARNGAGEERWFASAGGTGFDAQVAERMAVRRWWQVGRAGYLATTLAELRRFRNRQVTVTIDGVERAERVLLVAVANGPFYGGGMRIAPRAELDDGQVDVCVVGDVSRAVAIGQIPNLYRGTHEVHPRVATGRGRQVVIDGDGETPAHLDGEPFGRLPLSVSIGGWMMQVAAPAGAKPVGAHRGPPAEGGAG